MRMEQRKIKGILEAILFAAGREVKISEIMSALEISEEEVLNSMELLRMDYEKEDRGLSIVKINDAYQICTKKDYYEYIYPIFDKRAKPNLSQAALETLAIIAYNPRVTRAEIESIRGVNSDGTIYKLLDYNLIEEAGKLDAPGKPMAYKVSNEFFRMFGISSLEELPDLPRYKLDENHQIVVDEILEENEKSKQDELSDNKQETSEQRLEENKDEGKTEAPMPEREEESEF